MKIRIVLPLKDSKSHKTKLEPLIETVDDQESTPSQLIITALIEPGNCRLISEYLETETRGAGSISVLSLSVVEAEDEAVSLC